MYESLAEIYDSFAEDIDYDRWADELAGLIRQYAPGNRVAEVACGTGAIACRLCRAGFAVTGVDVSPEMLRKAEANARAFGVRLPLICQDMRSFRLHQPVDAIVCPCDGVNYLTQDGDFAAFVGCCAKYLAPGGVLIFDVSTEEKLKQLADERILYDLREDGGYFWQNEREGNLIRMELTVFVQEPDGRYRRTDETQYQRMYSKEEIVAQLSAFTLISASKVCYNQEKTDDRLQIVCKVN